jgi:hypothetical protein
MSFFKPDSTGALFLYLLLYAEIHYQIGRLFSFIKKREPECLVDVPHRLEPGSPLPLLLLVKDAHRYSVILHSLSVFLQDDKHKTELIREQFSDLHITDPFWYVLKHIPLPVDIPEKVKIDVEVIYSIDGKRRSFHNDNYRLTSHKPFEVTIDREPLPNKKNWYFGDLHYHSDFTQDQVEFGAPLDATREMAKAMGLSFFAATDHSYDLDDREGDYLANDPNFPKWHRFLDTVDSLNSADFSFIILPGEELSAGNAAGQNVHLLILNNRMFFTGSGDSAEKWSDTRPEYDIASVLGRIEKTAVAFAAHPEISPPLLQRLLLRRGKWLESDYRAPHLHGLQIWNSKKDIFFRKGVSRWVDQLKAGRRLSIVAGNDAHGNFSRFRQVGIPHLKMREDDSEIFARARTGVFSEDRLTFGRLITALQAGRAIVTDGPFAEILLKGADDFPYRIGDMYRGSRADLYIDVRSSAHFGPLRRVDLYIGDVAEKTERRALSIDPEPGCTNIKTKRHLEHLPNHGWIRLDAESARNGKHFRCLTNPIYLQNPVKKA